MAQDRSPAFQFYAADYLADEKVQLMTIEEEGCYIRLLAYCWREGSIPANQDLLTRLCKGVSPSDRVAMCFYSQGDRLRHKRLDLEREKQEEFRNEKSKAGMKGNAIRWKHKTNRVIAQRSHSDTSAIAKDRSSSSSSSSSSNNKHIQRASRMVPEDFRVTDDMRLWAKQEGLDADLDAETRIFLDHEFEKPKSNWPATWRNWIRNAEKYHSKTNGSKPKQKDILDQLLEQAEAEEMIAKRGGS
jgi:uncharacterized protein YdaU (DUF1376 family)